MKIYSLEYCNKLMNKYHELNGTVTTVYEGCLGLGTIVCEATGRKTAIINEIYLNSWNCGHTIRFYNKTPLKYQKLVEKIGA